MRVYPHAVFAGQPQDQFADFLARPGPSPTGRLRRLAAPGFAVDPAGEGPRRHDGDQVPDGRPQGLAVLEQPLPLLGRDGDPPGQLGPQDLVLGLEVLDLAGQVVVGGAGQQGEQRLEQGFHGGPIATAG